MTVLVHLVEPGVWRAALDDGAVGATGEVPAQAGATTESSR